MKTQTDEIKTSNIRMSWPTIKFILSGENSWLFRIRRSDEPHLGIEIKKLHYDILRISHTLYWNSNYSLNIVLLKVSILLTVIILSTPIYNKYFEFQNKVWIWRKMSWRKVLIFNIRSASSLSLIKNNLKFASDNLSMRLNNTARLQQVKFTRKSKKHAPMPTYQRQ